MTHTCHRLAVGRVIDVFGRSSDQHLSLQEMAEVAYISQFDFNRAPVNLWNTRQPRVLETAKRMVAECDLSVTDVCYEFIYEQLGTFMRRFTDLVGISPTRFRELASNSCVTQADWARRAQDDEALRLLHARVVAPQDWTGLIVAALFATALPEGRPLACAVAAEDRTVGLKRIAPGNYCLCVAALDANSDECSSLLPCASLVGRVPVHIGDPEDAREEIEIRLRPIKRTDPPRLMSLASLAGASGPAT